MVSMGDQIIGQSRFIIEDVNYIINNLNKKDIRDLLKKVENIERSLKLVKVGIVELKK